MSWPNIVFLFNLGQALAIEIDASSFGVGFTERSYDVTFDIFALPK